MAKGEKPAVSVAIKPVGGSGADRIYTLAGWERDGKVSSLQLDRKIKAIKFQMEDGKVIAITRDDNGKPSHYFDLFDNRTPQKRRGAFDDDLPPELQGNGEAATIDEYGW